MHYDNSAVLGSPSSQEKKKKLNWPQATYPLGRNCWLPALLVFFFLDSLKFGGLFLFLLWFALLQK